ncbi:MAG: dipeptide ABC transporter ATP-binding protein [Deltaproteobacteria bacterium]|nr:dipeptide ABC transporter ATP-binding protein [Deltaproteobacteria bacterium]
MTPYVEHLSQTFNASDELVRLDHVVKNFRSGQTFFRGRTSLVRAVDDVDMTINRGETLGLVGESGCGKTTLGKLVLRLERPNAGRIWFEGRDIAKMTGHEMKQIRRKMQVIFQDPYSSLNPRRTIKSAIMEPLTIHHIGSRADRVNRVAELMEEVGLRPEFAERYPHEFSGGQRQRIGIARALALNPSLIVADEPVSALDVSIRSQVLNLMEDLQAKYNLTYLFVSHDLSVVEHISDRVAVMYLGKIVEIGPKNVIYENTLHPYTEALLSAAPIPDPEIKRHRIILEGDVPSPINPPSGCGFHPRCWLRIPVCSEQAPELRDMGSGHSAACHVRAPAT